MSIKPSLPEGTALVGISLDGFLARSNGDLDWLEGDGGGGGEYGFNEFIAGIDAIVMGRNTFDKAITFDSWPYGSKRVVVLSHRPADLEAARSRGGIVDQMAGTPADVIARLGAKGVYRIYVDGGITIQEFLRAGLIRRVILSRLPILIGQGIPLFGSLPGDIRLRHIGTRTYPAGLVQSEYEVTP